MLLMKQFDLLSKNKWTLLVCSRRCIFLYLLFILLSTGFGLGGQEAERAQPLVHEHVLFTGKDGKLYIARDLPVYLHVSYGSGRQKCLLPVERKTSLGEDPPGNFFLNEGLNILLHQKGSGNIYKKGSGNIYRIYGDGTPPVTRPVFNPVSKYSKHIEGKKNIYFSKGLALDLVSNDTLSGVQGTYFSVNGQVFQLFSGPFSGFAGDAKNHLLYYSVDHVGNAEKPKSITFYLDVTPPRTQLNLNKGTNTSNNKKFYGGPGGGFSKEPPGCRRHQILSSRVFLSLSAIDNLSGVESIYYWVDNSKKRKYSRAINIGDLGGGRHTIFYFAVDNVGNIEKTGTFNYYCDNIPPQISLFVKGEKSRREDILFISPCSEIVLEARDDKAGLARIHCGINKSKQEIYTAPFRLPRESGLYRIGYWAEDKVANRGPVKTKKIYMDFTPPVTEWLITGPYFVNKNTLTISKNNLVSLVAVDLEAGVKGLKYRLNRGEELNYSGPLCFREEGEYRLTYFAVDGVGNREETGSLRLLVDNFPGGTGFPNFSYRHPRQWIVTEKGDITGPARLPFYMLISTTSGDDGKSFLLDINELYKRCEQSIGFKREGIQYLRLKAGKKEEVYRVNVDVTPPRTRPIFKGAQKYSRGGNLFFGSGLVLDFSQQDFPHELGSGFRKTMVSMNGSPFFTFKNPLKIFYIERVYLFGYYSVDQVGNVETRRETRFIVDTTPPRTIMELEGSAYGKVLSGHSVINLTASDNLSGVEAVYYQFDNGEVKRYRRSITGKFFRELPDGKHTLHYFASDNVGNREEAHRYSFYLDKALPEVKFEVLSDQFTRDGRHYVSGRSRIRLSAVKKPADVKTIYLGIDTVPEQVYTSHFTLPRESGKHMVSYYAVDWAGNRSAGETKALFLDLNCPETEIRLRGPVFRYKNRIYVGTGAEIELTPGDDLSGVKGIYYSLVSNNFKRYTKPLRFHSHGLHTLEYYAVDMVNNKEKTKKSVFYVDKEPPKVQIIYNIAPQKDTESEIPVFPGNVLVYLNAEDKDTDVDSLTYTLNNGVSALYRNPLSNFKTGNIITIKAIAVDHVGNTGAAEIVFRVENKVKKRTGND